MQRLLHSSKFLALVISAGVFIAARHGFGAEFADAVTIAGAIASWAGFTALEDAVAKAGGESFAETLEKIKKK